MPGHFTCNSGCSAVFRLATLCVITAALMLAGCASVVLANPALAAADPAVTTITVDVTQNQAPINPNVYGVAFAPTALVLTDLNVPLHRSGGNSTTRYNWTLNADNKASDWYFESIGYPSAVAGEQGDTFISTSKAGGAQAMLTIPTLGWVAKLGANRAYLWSFSQAKYGAQTGSDSQYYPDAGNGILQATNKPITGNDPNDADVPSDVAFQGTWMDHLVRTWGKASDGGLKYYLMDNEPSIWCSTHRDVWPVGQTMTQELDAILTYGGAVKARDPSALVAGPEEWGWDGYFYDGYDQQWLAANNYQGNPPDKTAAGGMDYLPWLLDQIHQNDVKAGSRTLDLFTVHYYPQSGEYSDDVSTATELLRNESTRSLWDPTYVDQSWIDANVELIPRIKNWAATYYPGTLTGITEYSWGADAAINGATAQADVLGIFGREGLDLACRWTAPAAGLPTYNAIKMYRNYDGSMSTFGDTSILTTAPSPDDLSAFGAVRSKDGACTVMVVNKDLSGSTPVSLEVAGFDHPGPAQVWQLTAANQISRLADVSFTGSTISTTLPAPSITLFVMSAAPASQSFTASSTATPGSVQQGAAVSIQSLITDNGPAVTGSVITLGVADQAGASVSSKSWTAQSFTSGQSQTYNWSVTAPSTPGVYLVSVNVTGPSGTPVYYSSSAAGDFTVEAPPPPAFTGTATASPATVAGGASAMITAQITDTGGPMTSGVVDLEVYDSSGTQVGQQFWQTESFTAAQAKTYTWQWTVPTISGAYTLEIGVFGPDWAPDYLWVSDAGTITVNGTAPPAFTGTASASPATIVAGASTTITAQITDTGGPLPSGVVDLEIYDSGGNKVGQQYWQTESFAVAQPKTYTWQWATPTTSGPYTIDIGVFGPNWAPGYLWAADAGTITVTPPAWTAVDAAVGSDSSTRILWSYPDGRAALWSLDWTSGNYTQGPVFGPYDGGVWQATRIACGTDGISHVLWNRGDGTLSLWWLNANNTFQKNRLYGPFAGWVAADIAVGSDNLARILWTNVNDGRAVVWSVDVNGVVSNNTNSYGPYPGYTAVALGCGSDGLTRLIWANPLGIASYWMMSASNQEQSFTLYGPYTNWIPTDIDVGSDKLARVLWTNTVDGRGIVWSVDANGNPTNNKNFYGPYPGYAAQRVTCGSDGFTRVTWVKGDGTLSFWHMASNNTLLTFSIYGPYH